MHLLKMRLRELDEEEETIGMIWIIYTRLEQVYKSLTILKKGKKRIVLETSPLSGFL